MTMLKRLKKIKTQQSFAAIIARRGLEPAGQSKLNALLIESLVKTEVHPQDDWIFWFYIFLVEQLAKLNDEMTARRVSTLII